MSCALVDIKDLFFIYSRVWIRHCYRYLHPLLIGEYPETMKRIVGSRLPSFTKAESNNIKGSVDFMGLNYYSSFYAKNNSSSPQMDQRDFMADMAVEFSCKFKAILCPRHKREWENGSFSLPQSLAHNLIIR